MEISFSDSFFQLGNDTLTKDEVLQPSSLSGYHWPDTDPTKVDQPTRLKSESDFKKVKVASTNVDIDWTMFEKNTRNMSLPEKIFQLLTNAKFQFNTRTAILQENLWLQRITDAVLRNEPITVAYPLLCKIGNWAKQMNNIGPNAGEESTILFFGRINTLVKSIYKPGIVFYIVCDAQLYNSAFQNPEVEVNSYITQCRQLIQLMQAECYVKFHNYVELLEPYSKEYLNAHMHYQKVLSNKPESIFNSINVKTLFDSVKASFNTRKFRIAYDDLREIFSNSQNKSNKLYTTIERMAMIAFEEVICIRMACSEMNILERIWPHHIRVTCHKGLKNGRAIIGLRPYPEYYGSSKLLSYHGIPVITNSKRGLKLDIQPEVMLRGRLDLVRVIDTNGQTYYYDGTVNLIN